MGHIRTPSADLDLDEIWYYIATVSGNIGVADGFIDSICDRFVLLARHPLLGRTREDLRSGLRSFSVADYLIIYRVHEGDVIILRVVRGNRDLSVLFAG